MTSVIRELVWLEIQENPGCTVAQIEISLGKDRGGVSTYITQMYKAYLIDRKELFIPCNNKSGKARCFTYTVAKANYSWVTPGMTKKIKAEAKAAKQIVVSKSTKPWAVIPEAQRAAVASLVSPVEPWIAMLPSLRVSDVLKLRKAIDEALTV